MKFEDSLVLVMNAGMYKIDQSPQGLYIQESKLIQRTNKVQNAYGNFYMQPNGVFYIQNDTPKIIQTKEERVNLVYAVKIDVKNDGSLKIGMPAEMWGL